MSLGYFCHGFGVIIIFMLLSGLLFNVPMYCISIDGMAMDGYEHTRSNGGPKTCTKTIPGLK